MNFLPFGGGGEEDEEKKQAELQRREDERQMHHAMLEEQREQKRNHTRQKVGHLSSKFSSKILSNFWTQNTNIIFNNNLFIINILTYPPG